MGGTQLVAVQSLLDAATAIDTICDQGEGVLFWDCTSRQRRRMAEALIRDLDRLSPEEFLYEWAVAEPRQFD